MQLPHLWEFVWTTWKHSSKGISAPPRSSQHCLQQPRYGANLSAEAQMSDEDVAGMHNRMHSAIKRMHLAICDNMDGPAGLREVKSDREKTNTVWFHLNVESKKHNKWPNITKQKTKTQNKTEVSITGNRWFPEGRGVRRREKAGATQRNKFQQKINQPRVWNAQRGEQ